MDIRLIKVDPDGNVDMDASMMGTPLTPVEESIQRIILCLMNTSGTMIESPGWGGSGMRLLNRNRGYSEDSKQAYSEVISNTLSSMLPNEDPSNPYAISDLVLMDVVSSGRGSRCVVKVVFLDATSMTVSLPNVSG